MTRTSGRDWLLQTREAARCFVTPEKPSGVSVTTRPTSSVESEQLAQAAAEVLQNEAFPDQRPGRSFSRPSKAQRDYDKVVREVVARRRWSREQALARHIEQEQAEAEATFLASERELQAKQEDELAQAAEPFDRMAAKARADCLAAIAAANKAYRQALADAEAGYRREAALVVQRHDAARARARSARDSARASIEARRQTELKQLETDLQTVSLEGLMRVCEDRAQQSPEIRRRALIALIEMAGKDDADARFVNVCLVNVAGYLFKEQYLPAREQHHRLMGPEVLETLARLAYRCQDRRPLIIRCLHDVVTQNPGHTSLEFIHSMTQLYMVVSTDSKTVYDRDPEQNAVRFDAMVAQISEILRLTPRHDPAVDLASRPRELPAQLPQAASSEPRLLADPLELSVETMDSEFIDMTEYFQAELISGDDSPSTEIVLAGSTASDRGES